MDQAAFGLSSLLVTAMVSRSSAAPEFTRFMILWTMGWTICALSTELLVTPLRIELPREQLPSRVVADLQSACFTLALSATSMAAAAVALRHRAASWLGILAVVASGLGFILHRAVLYTRLSVGAATRTSLANLAVTVLLLATVRLSGQPAARWGQVVAALALVAPLATSLRARWPAWRRIGPVALRLSRSGIWLATGSGLRNLVCSSGLLALVAHVHGLQAGAALAQTFVLASPVQLASSALPLLLLPSLVRSSSIGVEAFRRVLRRQLGVYLLCAAVGLTMLLVVFDWWRRLLVHEPEAAQVGYLPVASCVLGVLLSSWSGSALQAVRPPAYSFVATAAAALAIPGAIALDVPAPYLASLPWACSILAQVALTVTAPSANPSYSAGGSSTT